MKHLDVDFTHAFDRMNRNILFYKIKKSCFTGRVIDTLQNLYTQTKYRVKYNGEISDRMWENICVNQGGNATKLYICRNYAAYALSRWSVYGIM